MAICLYNKKMPNFIAYTLSFKIETNIDIFNVINLFLVHDTFLNDSYASLWTTARYVTYVLKIKTLLQIVISATLVKIARRYVA